MPLRWPAINFAVHRSHRGSVHRSSAVSTGAAEIVAVVEDKQLDRFLMLRSRTRHTFLV